MASSKPDLSDLTPSSIASAMQLRTRQEHNFDKIEHELPDPTSAALRLGSDAASTSLPFGFSLGDIFNKISDANPFGRTVAAGDEVWLFDNTAFRTSRLSSWQAEFVTAVFERNVKCRTADIVSGIADAVGLADDAEEKKTIEERIMPFLWKIRVARKVVIQAGGRQMTLGPTNVGGIAANTLKIEKADKGTFVKGNAQVSSKIGGILDMSTYYAGPEGWAIVSDIDDTIKITQTSDPIGILKETFVNPLRPVPGMPELYKEIQSTSPHDTAWFYLSASPYNLYPMLKDFRNKFYPPGTMILRDSSWKTISGLLSNLTVNTEEYKVDRLKKLNRWFPKRKMICIGDSTQSDPEAYGEMYRDHPDWIKLILIRKATDIAAIGLEEKNEPKRFEKAFEHVPRDVWHVFEDPQTCVDVVKRAMADSR